MPATLKLESTVIEKVNYLALGAHKLSGFTVKVEHSLDDSDYTTVSEFFVTKNNAIMVLFAETEVKYIKITITGTGSPEIGIAYFGKALVMERSVYGGHTPITMSRETEITPHISEAGEFLGTTVVRRGYSSGYNFNNLSASWVREKFDSFIQHARTRPFFIAWKPDRFADEVVYGWSPADIKPTNIGKRDLMSVSFDVRGYNEL